MGKYYSSSHPGCHLRLQRHQIIPALGSILLQQGSIPPLSSSPVDRCITRFGIRSIRSISQVGDNPRFVLDPSTHRGILSHTRSAMNCPKSGLYSCGWILTNCYCIQRLKIYFGLNSCQICSGIINPNKE